MKQLTTAKPIAWLAFAALSLSTANVFSQANLPEEFNDSLKVADGKKEAFKMILVKGDPEKGVEPFYMAETEVTWELFLPWSHWTDTAAADAEAEMKKGIRPTNGGPLEVSTSKKNISDEAIVAKHPAMGVTFLNAQKFCEMLSRKTGRKYRLPTEAEWKLAHQLGGGTPKDPQVKLDQAWCQENANDSADEDLTEEQKSNVICVRAVKTRKANSLGIHDMLGNVAEWVQSNDDDDPLAPVVEAPAVFGIAIGGDFTTPVSTLAATTIYKFKEDAEAEATGPEDNKSWWLAKHAPVGFRLVCEAASPAKDKGK